MKLSVANADNPWTLPDERCPDVYFTAGYGEAAATSAGGTWEAVHWEDRIIVPYVRRPIDERYVDAASPYGYSGVYVAPDCSPHDLQRFWDLASGYWRDTGMVAMFFRFPPFDEHSIAAAAGLEGMTLTYRADTITVPVTRGHDAIWKAMEGRSRTAVRKATTAGLVAAVRVATSSDLVPSSPFRQLYEQTMRRVDSSASYLFPDLYYQLLLTGLRGALMLVEVKRSDGEVLAASLVLVNDRRAHYHLAGSTVEGARQGANNQLLWTILTWASDTGRQFVHLGGGLSQDDNLFRFKRSFGGRRTPFSTGALVTDRCVYESLVSNQAKRLDMSTGDLLERGYFPAYRLGSDLL